MRTAAEMKARFAEQTEAFNRIRDNAVEVLFHEWVKALDAMIEAAFNYHPGLGVALPDEYVSVCANRFDRPPSGQSTQEIELLAADKVIVHFMDRGFNAQRYGSGSLPHQRVEVSWA